MKSAPHAARRVIAGAALPCVAALVTACGTASSPAAAPTRTVTVKATAAAPAGSASASPAPASSPAAPAGAPPCATRDLQVKPGVSQGAAGSTYQVLDFTNISNVTCTLYGYPGVSLAAGQPVTQIGLAAAESKATARQLVTLAPGAVANALLQIVNAENYPPSKCHLAKAKFLQIYPPNQTTPIYLGYTAQACAKPVRILTVGAVRPGAGSSS